MVGARHAADRRARRSRASPAISCTHLQDARKELGFDVTDRIRVAYAGNDRARRVLERHGACIAAETLAVELAEAEPGDAATPFEAEGASLRVAVRRA